MKSQTEYQPSEDESLSELDDALLFETSTVIICLLFFVDGVTFTCQQHNEARYTHQLLYWTNYREKTWMVHSYARLVD